VKSEVRIAMAHNLADRWLSEVSRKEYRFAVLPGSGKSEVDMRLLAGSLRSWRDGRSRIASIPSVTDLGVREAAGSNSLEVWSSNCEGLRKLSSWMEARGFETTFIW
jgi:hypothetical protein